MNPSARINTTIEILEKIESARIPMDLTCGDFLRFRRYIGSKDRSDIVERVYAVMRMKARLSWHLEQVGAEVNARNMVIAWLVFNDERDIKKLFNGEKYSPSELTENEFNFIEKLNKKTLESDGMPLNVKLEFRAELENKFTEIFGDNIASEMKAMLEPATLDLRVNVFKATREKVKAMLEADNINTEYSKYSPWGLRCLNKAYLSKSKAFSKGLLEIQDEGSQLIALAVNPQPTGMQVIDYCAGAGGKTLALASAMQVKGRIVAMDIEERRLEKSRQRLRRAGVADIVEVRPLSDTKHRKWLRRQKETFDAVLVDVPCSGSGTWRRNPDMRWTTYGPSLEELMNIQAEILGNVAHTIKQGGRLVYSTCSLFRDENENQIEAFLAANPEFKVLPISKAFPEGTVSPCDGDFMRLSPYQHGTDGFFAAVLIKE